MTNKTKRAGQISGGRMMGGNQPDMMRIDVIDAISGVCFCGVLIEPGNMMRALTGATVPCEFDVNGTELIGKRHEHKRERVPFDCYGTDRFSKERTGLDDHERSPSVDAALAPFETDGWIGSCSDLFNGHCRERGKPPFQLVNFHRYVDPATGKPCCGRRAE